MKPRSKRRGGAARRTTSLRCAPTPCFVICRPWPQYTVRTMLLDASKPSIKVLSVVSMGA